MEIEVEGIGGAFDSQDADPLSVILTDNNSTLLSTFDPSQATTKRLTSVRLVSTSPDTNAKVNVYKYFPNGELPTTYIGYNTPVFNSSKSTGTNIKKTETLATYFTHVYGEIVSPNPVGNVNIHVTGAIEVSLG